VLQGGLDLALMASLRLVENLKEATPMQVFNVQGMTCGHCVKAVTRAVQEQDAAARVEVDLAGKQVRVQSELAQEQILTAIRDEGYQAELA
jgi:copper chaperone